MFLSSVTEVRVFSIAAEIVRTEIEIGQESSISILGGTLRSIVRDGENRNIRRMHAALVKTPVSWIILMVEEPRPLARPELDECSGAGSG